MFNYYDKLLIKFTYDCLKITLIKYYIVIKKLLLFIIIYRENTLFLSTTRYFHFTLNYYF